MSRIGNQPIEIPAQVSFEKKADQLLVRGPKGLVMVVIPESIAVDTQNNPVKISVTKNDTYTKSLHGLLRSLINNAVIGVTKGWEKRVELVGVGYRATGGSSEVTLNVGFSHPVVVKAPKDITFAISDNTKITISGIDRKVVGEMAATLRAVKPPEPYKGKGIRYAGEIVRKKAGKAVKAATA